MKTLISNLSNNEPIHDRIPMLEFKENAEVLSPVITHICNKSLSVGKYSSNLYIACVSCLKQAGDRKKNPEYYIPPAILPSFSKIFGESCRNQIII